MSVRRLGWGVAALALTGCLHHHLAPPTPSTTALVASPKTIDSLWTVATDLYQRHKWGKAAPVFERVQLELLPSDRRSLLARLYLGDLYVRSGSNLQGVREYQRLVDDYPTDSLAPEALYRAAQAYAGLWRNPDLDPTYGITAKSVFTEVETRYPGTPAAARADTAITDLDNKFATKSFREATYYIKYKAYESAILYLNDLVLSYPHATVVPVALEDLVALYRRLGYDEDLRLRCQYMARNWGSTPEYHRACVANPVPADTGQHAGA